MNEILDVKRTDGRVSKVVIGRIIDQLEDFLPKDKKVVIITDSNVYGHYKDYIDRYEKIVIGLGEENKTLDTLYNIYSELIKLGADRESFILGFGGGIVTDIAGFTASTYMRGVRFGFVATTLLAQVDASVGGKNGVNIDGYKNMVGVFNQPEFVLCDLGLLKTLPDRELRSGMAEIIKSGLIRDAALFEMFEQYELEDFRRNENLLREVVTGAVRVKKVIVDRDEKEQGERKLLNLGHTFGHAIEKSTRRFLHGEAVAIGLVMAAKLSVRMGILPEEELLRICKSIEKAGLPIESGISQEVLFEALKSDKKKDADSVNMILLNGIGHCEIRKMKFDELVKYL